MSYQWAAMGPYIRKLSCLHPSTLWRNSEEVLATQSYAYAAAITYNALRFLCHILILNKNQEALSKMPEKVLFLNRIATHHPSAGTPLFLLH